MTYPEGGHPPQPPGVRRARPAQLDAMATPWPLGAGQAPQDGVWEDRPVAWLDVLLCM
jgi:hypothetical protein